MMTTFSDDDRGFTLIELLLVVVILGVVAALAVFGIRGVNDRGRDSVCEATLNSVMSASEAYFATNNRYPASLDELSSPVQFLHANIADVLGAATATPTISSGPNGWSITFSMSATTPPSVAAVDPASCGA